MLRYTKMAQDTLPVVESAQVLYFYMLQERDFSLSDPVWGFN
jgi:hypothetical protein